jgi:fructose-1,6-bisphosphatase/inositol monophosphatase family enzyme
LHGQYLKFCFEAEYIGQLGLFIRQNPQKFDASALLVIEKEAKHVLVNREKAEWDCGGQIECIMRLILKVED